MTREEILASATPRPWGRQTRYGDFPVYIGIDGGYGVAIMDGLLEERHADADLICLAVNSYEAREKLIGQLVEALEGLLRAHGQLMPGIAHIAVQDYANINEAPIDARAALAAAKERT